MAGPYDALDFHEHIRKRLITRGISESEVRYGSNFPRED